MRPAARATVAPALMAGVIALGAAHPVSAQIQWRDLVFTGGFSAETYNGNFSAVTVPVVDSADHAAATIGEFSAAGEFLVAGRLRFVFDAGFRQFATTGFQQRDFAPREWVGRVDADWATRLSTLGVLSFAGTARGRSLSDRPPLPLFLQPGSGGLLGAARFDSRPVQDVRFDLSLDVERTDYDAPTSLPQLDLLDRRSWGTELGVSFGPLLDGSMEGGWSLRFHTAFRRSEYPDQRSFDPDDPFRRDRTVQVGGSWSYQGRLLAEIGVEGTVNRSNSDRPEYDAFNVRSVVSASLPWWRLGVTGLARFTGKTYVHDVPFTRLVPGEEAENASIVYVEFDRPMATNVTGAMRFGWTRAETDFGEAYYSRYGVTLLFRYRPAL